MEAEDFDQKFDQGQEDIIKDLDLSQMRRPVQESENTNIVSKNNLPNFLSHGYEVLQLLGNNQQGGRFVYQAKKIETQELVVIKQFRFANSSDWQSYREIEREIETLKDLNHPNIPRYLDHFDSTDGLCLVQEFLQAESLSRHRSFASEEIKAISIKILEILVYLQQRIPPIIHRDIKPENILVDKDLNVYLIDFGLARIGHNTLALSSIFGGTLGFMPPEQIHNQKLTKATDLYGLGVMLICLITQIESSKIGDLVNFQTNKIQFKDKVPQLSFRFIEWLDKMLEPDPEKRYQDAETALNALEPLYIVRLPELKINQTQLNFQATKLGEKLTQVIDITNEIPETVLQGEIKVALHPSDPIEMDHQHSWIKINPNLKFQENQIKYAIIVDTANLKADKVYERCLFLTSNAATETYELPVTVKTAPAPIKTKKMPYFWLSGLLTISLLIPYEITFATFVYETIMNEIESIIQHKPFD